ncbi:MAG TPA: AMP-binding protein [Chloroflexota bacterium]
MGFDPLEAGEPNAIAIVSDAASYTYGEFRRLRGRMAKLLRGEARHRLLVFIFTDRALGGITAYLACLHNDDVAGWLPAITSESQLSALLDQYGPDRLVLTHGQWSRWGPVLRTDGYQHVESFGLVIASSTTRRAEEVSEEVTLLLRTSGISGAPKMVKLSADGLIANSDAIRVALRIGPASRAVTSLPLHYTYGLSILHSHLYAGGSIVLTDLPHTGRSFWWVMSRNACTSFAGVPHHFEWLRGAVRRWPELPVPRTVTVSGGSMRRETLLAMDDLCRTRGGEFYVMYGQTEATARITVLPPADIGARGGSVGLPVGDWTIRVLDKQDRPVRERHSGRIVLWGRSAMLGYATCRADLAERGGPISPLDTGDHGCFRDGYLYLTGRSTRMIKPAGVRVALDDIERELGELAEVAVVGFSDQSAVACYRRSAPAERLAERWVALAAALRVPTNALAIRPVRDIPLTDRGKVDYRALSAEIGITPQESSQEAK